jgi:hypothetical protein
MGCSILFGAQQGATNFIGPATFSKAIIVKDTLTISPGNAGITISPTITNNFQIRIPSGSLRNNDGTPYVTSGTIPIELSLSALTVTGSANFNNLTVSNTLQVGSLNTNGQIIAQTISAENIVTTVSSNITINGILTDKQRYIKISIPYTLPYSTVLKPITWPTVPSGFIRMRQIPESSNNWYYAIPTQTASNAYVEVNGGLYQATTSVLETTAAYTINTPQVPGYSWGPGTYYLHTVTGAISADNNWYIPSTTGSLTISGQTYEKIENYTKGLPEYVMSGAWLLKKTDKAIITFNSDNLFQRAWFEVLPNNLQVSPFVDFVIKGIYLSTNSATSSTTITNPADICKFILFSTTEDSYPPLFDATSTTSTTGISYRTGTGSWNLTEAQSKILTRNIMKKTCTVLFNPSGRKPDWPRSVQKAKHSLNTISISSTISYNSLTSYIVNSNFQCIPSAIEVYIDTEYSGLPNELKTMLNEWIPEGKPRLTFVVNMANGIQRYTYPVYIKDSANGLEIDNDAVYKRQTIWQECTIERVPMIPNHITEPWNY